MNADGIIGANDDTISHNLFAYVSNSPINMGDFDGNVAGLMVATSGALAAGTISALGGFAVGGLAIAFLVGEAKKEKAKAQASVKSKTKTEVKSKSVVYKKAETRIYRGGTSNRALTPRISDSQTGLSFHNYPNQGNQKYTVTTVEKINSTGVLVALPKLTDPNHYHVIPAGLNKKDQMQKLSVWINTRENADIAPHPYTSILKSISWVEKH